MAKKLSEQVEVVLKPFEASCGVAFNAIVLDVASMLGHASITTVEGEWTPAANFKLTAKDQHKTQLAPNNPASHLFWFALSLNKIAKAGEFEINADVPKTCKAWVEEKIKKTTVAPVKA